MKTIAIGDIHGDSSWKKIVEKHPDDKIVFIGDYFDSFNIPAYTQKENFKDIIEFKKANEKRVTLLFGNHDYHYLPNISDRYSGYQELQQIDIQILLKENLHLMQMCYIQDNFIFSHAGVTKTWTENNNIGKNIERDINNLFKYKPNAFKFTMGKHHSVYGDDVEQSPIWVRPYSLRKDRMN